MNSTASFVIRGRHCSVDKPLLIAEIGTGHGGDLVKAKELIHGASEAGAGCAKFQYVLADEILHPNTGEVPLPGGSIRLYDRFRALELDLDFYRALKEMTEERGLLFLCTPFGPRSAAALLGLGVRAMKIASPELNYVQLIDAISGANLPTFLSSGVSKVADIERALEHISPALVCLLHCVTAYPAPEEEYNLRILSNLRGLFGVPVGVSDHSLDPILVPALSVACGAVAVEKHFCLSKKDGGLDDPIALTPEELARTADAMARAATNPQEAISRLEGSYGRDRVNAVLGDGIKRLAPSELQNYDRTNRSLHATRALKVGDLIGPEDVRPLRTEKVLRPGLPPWWLDAVIGKTVRVDIPDGEGIRFQDL